MIDETLLDTTTRNAEESPRLRKNYNFHKSESDPVNWMLNGLQRGTFVQPHRHLAPERDEMVVVLRGRVASFIFDEAGNVTQKAVIDPQADTFDNMKEDIAKLKEYSTTKGKKLLIKGDTARRADLLG